MAKFSYDHPLPSLHLTKELLETLERYLTQQISQVCSLESEDANMCFSVSIDDNLGTEKFGSVKDFHPSRFSLIPRGASLLKSTHLGARIHHAFEFAFSFRLGAYLVPQRYQQTH